MRTVDTRHQKGYIWRRRQCRECGSRTTTYETTTNPKDIKKFNNLLFQVGEFVEDAL